MLTFCLSCCMVAMAFGCPYLVSKQNWSDSRRIQAMIFTIVFSFGSLWLVYGMQVDRWFLLLQSLIVLFGLLFVHYRGRALGKYVLPLLIVSVIILVAYIINVHMGTPLYGMVFFCSSWVFRCVL